jgi:hypothetical protein
MALLVYSAKCKFSQEILAFIKAQPALSEIVRLHEIGANGVPSKKITRVPTLITNEGKMCVGADVKAWLESMCPNELEMWEAGGPSFTNIDGSENSGMFELDRYGKTLQPEITPELKKKIEMSVDEAQKSARSS